MEDVLGNISTPLGILLVVVGIILALKVARLALKLVFMGAIAVGLYLWFGVNGGGGP